MASTIAESGTKTSTPWPPPGGLSSPTVGRKQTILQTTASAQVSAPATTVWHVLRDTSNYPKWNSFAPSVTILSQPNGDKADPMLWKDTSFILHVDMGKEVPGQGQGPGGRRADTQLRVLDVSTPDQPSRYIDHDTLNSDPGYYSELSELHRISWTTEGLYVKMGIRSERFHEIIETGPEQCDVRTWECQGGFAARAVKWMFKDNLDRGFQAWVDGLKKESEEQWARQQENKLDEGGIQSVDAPDQARNADNFRRKDLQ